MKQRFLTAAFAFFALSVSITSCSDDDAGSTNNNGTSAILPVKAVYTDEDSTFVENLTYNGNKVVKDAYSDGTYDEFTYTGDNITAIKSYDETGALIGEELFTYNSSNQVTVHLYKWFEDDYAERVTYTYNSNGTVNTTEYWGDLTSQTEVDGTGIMTVVDGNVTSYAFTPAGETTADIDTFTFDNKNNPLKNVTGFEALNIAFTEGGVNNFLTRSSYGTNYTYTHTYNSDNFPVKSIESVGGTVLNTMEYTYNN